MINFSQKLFKSKRLETLKSLAHFSRQKPCLQKKMILETNLKNNFLSSHKVTNKVSFQPIYCNSTNQSILSTQQVNNNFLFLNFMVLTIRELVFITFNKKTSNIQNISLFLIKLFSFNIQMNTLKILFA
ncbi:hypothetical protein ABPG74_006297 [Tetrahymena malaccensis]